MKKNTKKSSKLPIESDIRQRLLEIRSGNVYNGKLTFIKELGQNAFRANATKVWVTVENDTFIMKDNGDGCKNPKDVFTLDFSGFGVGFGVGFSSIYMIADWFKVETADWSGELNIVEKLDNPRTTKDDLSVDLSEGKESVEGFTLTLVGKQIQEYAWSIMDEVRELFQYNPTVDAYLNGELIEKQNLHDKIRPGDYCVEVDNRLFTGKLSLTPKYFDTRVQVYYEYRFVQELHIDGVKGVIALKPNAVNLKAPDRTYIIDDNKKDRLVRRIEKEIKPLFKQLVASGSKSEIEEYSRLVKEYLTVKEYIDYLEVDLSFLPERSVHPKEETSAIRKQAMKAVEFYEMVEQTQVYGGEKTVQMSDMHSDDSIENVAGVAEKEAVAVVHSAELAESSPSGMVSENEAFGETESVLEEVQDSSVAVDTVRHIQDTKFRTHVTASEHVEKDQLNGINIKNIKKKKNIVWCSIDEKEKYQHYITQFEYNNIYTFISPHELYDEALRHLNIPHVSDFDRCIVEDNKVTQTGARNKKEERATEILSMIEKKYRLPETFFISNIQSTRKIELNGKKVHQEKVTIYGYKMADYIHLNRKHLYFGNVRGSRLGEEKLNIHDLKFIVANASLIGHELAHLLYGTKDNTKEHYEAEIRLRDEIVRTAIEEWS